MPSVTDTASIQGRLLFFAFVVAGCALSFFFSSIMGWAFLAALTFAVILLGHPRTLLLTYAGWITVQPYLDKVLGSNIFLKWSDEAMAAALLGILLFNTEQHRRRPELKWVNRSLVTLLCLVGISGIANQVPKMDILHFCLQYLRWYLIFYAAIIFLGNQSGQTVLRGMMVLFVMQLVPNIGWALGVNPMPNWMSGPDISIGTGMGASVVGYFSVVVTCLGLAIINASRTTRHWVMGVGIMAMGFVQLYLTFTIHAYILLVVCLAVQLMLSGALTRYLHLLVLAISGCILSVLVVVAFNSRLSSEYFSNMTPDYIAARWQGMVEGPKGQAYHDVLFNLPNDIPFAFIGAGPGNAGSNVAMQNRRPLADQYFNWILLSSAAEYQRVSEGSSITSGPHTGVLAILSELGPIGFIAFWGIHAYALLRIMRFNRKASYSDRTQAILADAFVPSMLMLLILAWIADYWYSAFVNNMIWIWAAVIWTPLAADAHPTDSTVPA